MSIIKISKQKYLCTFSVLINSQYFFNQFTPSKYVISTQRVTGNESEIEE